MRTQTCKKCNFQFTEADKHWDEFRTTNQCPKCEAYKTQQTSGNRFVIAFVSWCFVGFGALSSLMFVSTGLIVGFLPLVAWASLAIMTYYWLQNRKCHWNIAIDWNSCRWSFSSIFCIHVLALCVGNTTGNIFSVLALTRQHQELNCYLSHFQ